MITDIARFEQFFSLADVRLEQAKTTDEVQRVLAEAKTLAHAARLAKDREYEEKMKVVQEKSHRRLGIMLAHQRDAGMLNPGSKGTGTKVRGNDNPTLSDAGIDKNLAKAARKAYPEGWPSKPNRSPRVNKVEAVAQAFKEETGNWPTHKTLTQVAGVNRRNADNALRTVKAVEEAVQLRTKLLHDENIRLKEEVVRLKSDLEALQTGNLMQMSLAAMDQRKAIAAKMKAKREVRAETETVPTAKTVEDYERQINRLKNQVNTEKVKAMALDVQRGTIKTISNADRKLLLVLLHPDRATDPAEKAKLERAFKLINAIPELVEV